MSGASLAIPAARAAIVAHGEAAFIAARRQRRLATLLGLAILAGCLLVSAWISEFYPSSLIAGAPRVGEYFAKIMPSLQWQHLFGGIKTEGSLAYWFYRADDWLWLIFQTAQMAALATLGGAVIALPVSFLAARNLSPNPWAYQLARRGLEAMRTVPEIVYALIFVWAFGIGGLAELDDQELCEPKAAEHRAPQGSLQLGAVAEQWGEGAAMLELLPQENREAQIREISDGANGPVLVEPLAVQLFQQIESKQRPARMVDDPAPGAGPKELVVTGPRHLYLLRSR